MTNNKAIQIANSISLVANIPPGDGLVHILGMGNESNNKEALSSWIEQQQDLLNIDKPDYMIEQLIHRLHSKLNGFNSFIYEINE